MVTFDAAVGNWSLAVAANTVNSPGANGPIGHRFLSLDDESWGRTSQPGDYGIYWDSVAGQGFAWANVDHSSDFVVGEPLCRADCLQTPDGVVDIRDLFAMFAVWGSRELGGPCDIDLNGHVGFFDLFAMFEVWGPCPTAPAAASPLDQRRSPDIDTDGVVGRNDLSILRSSWGPCPVGCPGDLNGDGVVDPADELVVLDNWGR